ncbi:hypothetical protein EJ07DRAFT_159461 [Lizonia empirigonia]|nr:hypothetical protein EJ07DRAFT_159461 [Lizonia empirigonia]
MSAKQSEAMPTEDESAETNTLLLTHIIFELVQHLDFRTLLRCQRVCRKWRSVIHRSAKARETLFLKSSDELFNAFKAAEEQCIAQRMPEAWDPPQERILERPEFRALFNPWVFTHDWYHPDAPGPSSGLRGDFRFTDRISSGHVYFRFKPAYLCLLINRDGASWNTMFLTQPPIRRVLATVSGSCISRKTFDVEVEEGIKIGDIMACLRGTEAGKFDERKGGLIPLTAGLCLKFDEHFTGVSFMPLQYLDTDESGNEVTVTT